MELITNFYTYCWELVTVWPIGRIVVTGLAGFFWFAGTMLSVIDYDKPVTRITWSVTIFTLLFVCWPILLGATLIMIGSWWIEQLKEENEKA